MKNYKTTLYASYIGYIIQAIVINFAPLLFVTFRNTYGLTLSNISALIMINFAAQLAMDFLSSWYIDKLGYRKCALLAHVSAFFGIGLMAFLPDMINPFIGLSVCMVLSGMGGGLIEVIISPIVEALPTKSKSAAMSLLHSFYSWGQLLTVLVATAFFAVYKIENWRVLAYIFAAVPFINGILFAFVPIKTLEAENESVSNMSSLIKNKSFWLFLGAMVCGGAAEQAVIQWVSAFAESGLKVSKTVGDLLGPALFALLMGISRTFYARFRERLKLMKYMKISAWMLLAAYLITVFSPFPALSLVGCALCGLAVGICWPGMLSLSSRKIKGGAAMFALLAFFGDIGCITGPGITGLVSDTVGGNLRAGFLAAAVFPLTLIILLYLIDKKEKKS